MTNSKEGLSSSAPNKTKQKTHLERDSPICRFLAQIQRRAQLCRLEQKDTILSPLDFKKQILNRQGPPSVGSPSPCQSQTILNRYLLNVTADTVCPSFRTQHYNGFQIRDSVCLVSNVSPLWKGSLGKSCQRAEFCLCRDGMSLGVSGLLNRGPEGSLSVPVKGLFYRKK